MKGKKCAELQMEAYHKGYDEGVAQTHKDVRGELKKKVEGMKFDTEGTLLDVYQEQFEDGYNKGLDDVLTKLKKLTGGK